MSPDPARAEIVVDVATIRANVRRLRALVAGADTPGVQMMTVDKADGYGHGMVPAGRAAREAGAEWLGVATIDEALALRDAGDTGPVLCWLGVPGEDYAAAIAHGIDVTAYSLAELAEIGAAAREVGRVARLQLKVDTGLSRGGCTMADWPTLVGAARKAEVDDLVDVTGVWSHFACSEEPDNPATRPTTPRRRSSARRSTSQPRPASSPRCATSPTVPPPSCDRAPASTWSGAGSRATASTRRPASPAPPPSAWCRR